MSIMDNLTPRQSELLDALASTAGTTPEKLAAQILARGIETQAARLMNAKEYAG